MTPPLLAGQSFLLKDPVGGGQGNRQAGWRQLPFLHFRKQLDHRQARQLFAQLDQGKNGLFVNTPASSSIRALTGEEGGELPVATQI